MSLQAVVFDFDGVIVDTERIHYAALNQVLSDLGLDLTWADYVQTYIGFDDRGVFQTRFREVGRALAPEELARLVQAKAGQFHRLVSEETPTPFPGVVALIRSLSGCLPLALCSGALRSDIDPIFQALDLHGVFDLMVTADDVPVSKPHPACYRLAMERLGARYGRTLEPAQSLAIEDTPAGITAARGAGLRVLALTNSYDRAYLGQADFVRDSLENVGYPELQGLLA